MRKATDTIAMTITIRSPSHGRLAMWRKGIRGSRTCCPRGLPLARRYKCARKASLIDGRGDGGKLRAATGASPSPIIIRRGRSHGGEPRVDCDGPQNWADDVASDDGGIFWGSWRLRSKAHARWCDAEQRQKLVSESLRIIGRRRSSRRRQGCRHAGSRSPADPSLAALFQLPAPPWLAPGAHAAPGPRRFMSGQSIPSSPPRPSRTSFGLGIVISFPSFPLSLPRSLSHPLAVHCHSFFVPRTLSFATISLSDSEGWTIRSFSVCAILSFARRENKSPRGRSHTHCRLIRSRRL